MSAYVYLWRDRFGWWKTKRSNLPCIHGHQHLFLNLVKCPVSKGQYFHKTGYCSSTQRWIFVLNLIKNQQVMRERIQFLFHPHFRRKNKKKMNLQNINSREIWIFIKKLGRPIFVEFFVNQLKYRLNMHVLITS